MEGKPWYTSKTIIAQIIAVGVTLLGAFGVYTAPEWLSAELTAFVWAGMNIYLRLVTKQPVA